MSAAVAWSIPRARRYDKAPGPGSYSPEDNQKNAHNNSMSLTQTNVSVFKTNPAFSIGKEVRKQLAKLNNGPGVGAYDINQIGQFFKKAPNYSFGVKTPTIPVRLLNNPGPTSYNVDDSFVSHKQPAYKIGASNDTSREHNSSFFTPGPGQYDLPDKFKETASMTFTKEQRKLSLPTTPGPGTYGIEGKLSMYLETSPQFSFGGQKRQHNYNNFVPSSAVKVNLESIRERPKRIVFGHSKRLVQRNSMTPGPGQYDANMRLNQTGFQYSIPEGKRLTTTISATPGPASYEPIIDLTRQGTPQIRIGKSERSSPERNKYNGQIPGPASYNTYYNHFVLKSEPKHSFPHANRLERFRSLTPGPADYNIPPLFANVPKYSLNNSTIHV